MRMLAFLILFYFSATLALCPGSDGTNLMVNPPDAVASGLADTSFTARIVVCADFPDLKK